MSLRELGLLSIILLWIPIIYMLRRWRGNRSMSVSMHAASARPAYFLSAVVQTITGILFFVFMTEWFIPYFNLPLQVTVVLTTAIMLQILATWVAETHGFKRRFHRFCAFSMALLMPVVVAQTLIFAGLTIPTLLVGIIVFLYMITSATFFILTKPIRRHFLPYQLAYVAGFHLFILAATYLS